MADEPILSDCFPLEKEHVFVVPLGDSSAGDDQHCPTSHKCRWGDTGVQLDDGGISIVRLLGLETHYRYMVPPQPNLSLNAHRGSFGVQSCHPPAPDNIPIPCGIFPAPRHPSTYSVHSQSISLERLGSLLSIMDGVVDTSRFTHPSSPS
ncbi:hypothetical protein M433DRAFT_188925 [Acidomyces richmondensis BFW]|nr:hypothetical protein M433DRAFT_188925 [Acidomyces richmondensis BFW]